MKKIITFYFVLLTILVSASSSSKLSSLDIDFGYSTDFSNNNFLVSVSCQKDITALFSYTPFINFNLDTFGNNSEKLKHNLNITNSWADSFVSNTVPLNILLLGAPYVVMGIADIIEYPYLAIYGITLDLHPVSIGWLDTKFSIGIENNCYEIYKKQDKTY